MYFLLEPTSLIFSDIRPSYNLFFFFFFFSMNGSVCFCNNIDGLLAALGIGHDPQEWRLFIDSSKVNHKRVLLYSENDKSSISIVHAAQMKETYKTLMHILQ